ncbi:peptidase S16, lon domain protein [Alkaliphilus metalliredigens QYMF]|uniref:endopeptidase La n=1 Tax=Alkaliphilus metalliredigens (strain QYMF) TaxID=293826 RepID=A6TVJ6_ALKMQ|nr:ATP-binding protein [Alkaliphilus metalliredigens]ABR50214.1 peptidase S16, lon domain protein [Alkaliphilus metalliredigens QYMF]
MRERLRLAPEKLTSPCLLSTFDFETTAELRPLEGIIGQNRAVEALTFGLKVRKKGYNIYIAGLSGTGRSSYANSIGKTFAKEMRAPNDWAYVYNFKSPDRPKALAMEAGTGKQFEKDIENMIDQLKQKIPLAFEGTEYETKRNAIYRRFQDENQKIVEELNKISKEYGFIFKDSEQGLMTVPLKEGRPMSQEEYESLAHEEIEALQKKSSQLNIETMSILTQIKAQEEKLRKVLKELDEEIGYKVVNHLINKLLKRYSDKDKIKAYLNDIEENIVEHIERFKTDEKDDHKNPNNRLLMGAPKNDDAFFNRYKVNLFVDNNECTCGPIVNETNPTFSNLLGTIEYRNEMGVLKTDFTQIKQGSLHMANGGFLILDAKEILSQPFGWETLKRALKTGEINIENLNKQMGYVVTSTLKPEPIPLELKVILIGDLNSYYLLYQLDEDFKKLFKIMADFDVEMPRNQDHIKRMGQFIATHCKKEGLKDFHKTAVARIIEYSSRLADHQEKLSARFNQIVEILYEADLWATESNQDIVLKEHVEKAIQMKVYRNNKYEEKLNEMFEERSLLLDVSGKKIGQINGLVVMGTGEYQFGKPSRITVSTYKGKSGIINIEREVKKSGSIHDKGVLILSGYLGYKYAQRKRLSLSVSISFEQNYSMIDGDSASSTELYAILSSIAEVPIKQNLAVTGSINQKGEIQPIGGINEKIEGFFDICKLKGLTGDQGVIMPQQNVTNLMLKEEVIQAVKEEQFHIYSICHVDEGIQLLTDFSIEEIDKRMMKKLDSVEEETEN